MAAPYQQPFGVQQRHPPQQHRASAPSPPEDTSGFGGVGSEQMLQFAAGTLKQNVGNRLQSAVPIFGHYWAELKSYFEVMAEIFYWPF